MANPVVQEPIVQTDQAGDAVLRLAAKVAEEMAAAWRSGRRLSADEFLARHPDLAGRPEAALRVIYEEICQRQDAGESVGTVEVLGRFPQWQAELAVMLDCHRLLDSTTTRSSFPKVGEELSGFRLLSELGRGALGRVFLATEAALGDRPVVLKVTPCDTFEHISLARLQHSYIVPLHTVYDLPERRLRVLCMPYLGGTTLERLLIVLHELPHAQRTGKDFLAAIDAAQSMSVPLLRHGPLRRLLAQETYVEAVCRMGACLADALAFAHDRGLVHLDVKPSNVLITADAEPMLLDFNLAHAPLKAGALVLDHFGGTRGYMSPEQQVAFDAIGDSRPLPADVDGRSDVYALGLTLYNALGGAIPMPYAISSPSAGPTTPNGGTTNLPRLNHINTEVSVGLADIIHKCLAKDPRRRYVRAADLAADLRRHLHDQPLRGIYNRSPVERWTKWRKRQPLALAWVCVFMAVFLALWALGRVALSNYLQLQTARKHLIEGRQLREQGVYHQAIPMLTRGKALAEGVSSGDALLSEFSTELRLTTRAQAADALHEIADKLRFAVDLDLLTSPQLHDLEKMCVQMWEQRGPMLHSEGADLTPALEKRIRADLLDVLVLWTDLRVRGSTSKRTDDPRQGVNTIEAHREALRILREARQELGGSSVLAYAIRDHSHALDEPVEEDVADRGQTPATASEEYALGRHLLQIGRFDEAMRHLQQAVETEPQAFWPNFYLGVGAFRLQRYAEAVQSFRVCLALAHERAPCWFNRGRAYAALGPDEWHHAIYDYTRALELDPSLTSAALNRGIVHLRLKHFSEAVTDFESALRTGGDTAAAHYHLALAFREQNKRQEAMAQVQKALLVNPQYAEAKTLLELMRRD